MFTEEKKLIDTHLASLIFESTAPQGSLYSAARYSLLNDAKRIRPILTLAVCKTYGIPYEKALNSAASLEMVHTYSLIHDDLPCMDDDDLRRGKPTLHRAFSEAKAVLAGDFLLTKAFEIIANDPHLTDDTKIELIRLLSERAGGDGMIGGQIIDIESEGKKISPDLLNTMHNKKTGALIACSVEFGSIIAKTNQKDRKMLKDFGLNIGLAFQIIDDVLDITSSFQDLGKDAASDLKYAKCTYPSTIGLNEAKSHAKKLLIQAEEALEMLSVNSYFLKEIASYIIHRKS